jgi:hypothetical protein
VAVFIYYKRRGRSLFFESCLGWGKYGQWGKNDPKQGRWTKGKVGQSSMSKIRRKQQLKRGRTKQ